MGSPFQRSQNISLTPEESAPKIKHNIMWYQECVVKATHHLANRKQRWLERGRKQDLSPKNMSPVAYPLQLNLSS